MGGGTTTANEQAIGAKNSSLEVEDQLCDLIKDRQRKGIAKYGQTVANNPLSLREWLQHALEEALDLCVYLKRAINQLDQGITQLQRKGMDVTRVDFAVTERDFKIKDPPDSYEELRKALRDGHTVQRCMINSSGGAEKWNDVTAIDEEWAVSRYRILYKQLGANTGGQSK
jgi:hypothetical protein